MINIVAEMPPPRVVPLAFVFIMMDMVFTLLSLPPPDFVNCASLSVGDVELPGFCPQSHTALSTEVASVITTIFGFSPAFSSHATVSSQP